MLGDGTVDGRVGFEFPLFFICLYKEVTAVMVSCVKEVAEFK